MKPEWGAKRVCHSCGSRFYDLGRRPIVCPACETVLDLDTLTRGRRNRSPQAAPAKPEVAVPVKPVPAEVEDEEEVEAEEEASDIDVEVEVEADKEGEDTVIEDASELGEDEDDMAEVMDNVDDEKEA